MLDRKLLMKELHQHLEEKLEMVKRLLLNYHLSRRHHVLIFHLLSLIGSIGIITRPIDFKKSMIKNNVDDGKY